MAISWASADQGQFYYDCDGDNVAAPKDLTAIISHLNGYGASEGEANPTTASGDQSAAANTVPTDVLTLLAADAALQATRPKR